MDKKEGRGIIKHVARTDTNKQKRTLKESLKKLLTCVENSDKINKSLKGGELNGL